MGVKTRKLGNANNSIVEWQSVVVADGSTGLTAVAGRGYFINTTGGAITVTLPTPKVGDVIRLKDYARTWHTNNVNIASALLDGATTTTAFSTQGQTVSLVYMDGTKGWSIINEDTSSKLEVPPAFTAATGGTVTTSGDFKIHSFTGDGNFVTNTLGNSPVSATGGPTQVSYVVVAGGGGAGVDRGGGGGAGGFREGRVSSPEYTASPLATTGLTIAASTTYPITVGGGGAGGVHPGPSQPSGVSGSPSVFSTITSTGGGGGKNANTGSAFPGGSGAGSAGSGPATAGTGNTPPVSPPQGNPGGDASDTTGPRGAGGGGAGAAAVPAGPTPGVAPGGGAGVTSHITGSPVARAGGGAGTGSPNYQNSGGSGGGGNSSHAGAGSSGTANTGGGGGASNGPGGNAGAGGKGIVIIRYKFQ